MCECQCQRLHLDDVGPIARSVARWANKGLEAYARKNGAWPRTLPGVTWLIELMLTAANGSSGAESLWVDSAAAASLLGRSERGVRWLARHGHLQGAVKVGHCWLIPRSSVSHYRSNRNAA